jgi:oxygen-independent coproporphyrinogen-3 oxidase
MIDFDKFAKYSRPGPRYTSYPTAPEFSTDFSEDDYINYLKNLDDKRKLSIYIHIPFCRSACYFCGCNVIYTSKNDKKTRYLTYLHKEIELLKTHLDTTKEVEQIHLGGGTPTFLSPDELEEVLKLITDTFSNISKTAEISCEIDPRFFSYEHMQVLKKYGTNRLSFGIQDFEPKVQTEIHRVQPFELTQNMVNIARDAGINSINVDLIYGLPYQTKESFANTLDMVLKLDPDRLAVFNYAHVPWMKKTMRKFDENTMPEPKTKLEILKYTLEFFTSNGYNTVGMDHFAKPEDELFKAIEKGELHRNFQGYTTKGGTDLIGIGVTSIGNSDNYFAQNFKDIKEYEEAIDSGHLPIFKGYKLSEDDKLRQSVIMEIMSNFRLDIKRVEENFNITFNEYFADELSALEEFTKEELVTIDEEFITISATGTMLIRNIVMPFDAYLKKIPENQRRFSKTV